VTRTLASPFSQLRHRTVTYSRCSRKIIPFTHWHTASNHVPLVCITLHYMLNRPIRLSDVRFFKIYPAKILRKLTFLLRETLSHVDFRNRRWPKIGYSTIFEKLIITYFQNVLIPVLTFTFSYCTIFLNVVSELIYDKHLHHAQITPSDCTCVSVCGIFPTQQLAGSTCWVGCIGQIDFRHAFGRHL
jgi:hypothetical protein